jgi:hypothetical protein
MDPFLDIDELICRLAYPLPDDRKDAFYAAAQRAVMQLRCPGPGVAHRTLARLLASYFVPPPAAVIGAQSRVGNSRRRPSKLIAAAPVA